MHCVLLYSYRHSFAGEPNIKKASNLRNTYVSNLSNVAGLVAAPQHTRGTIVVADCLAPIWHQDTWNHHDFVKSEHMNEP